MKSQNQKLIALAAAVLFTTSSLSAVSYNVATQPTAATEIRGIKVINLPAVNVESDRAVNYNVGTQPTAATEIQGIKVIDLPAVNVQPVADSLPSDSHIHDASVAAFASLPMLLGSQLAMPYYSFSKKFGRISKE